jgi:hypothetical protein
LQTIPKQQRRQLALAKYSPQPQALPRVKPPWRFNPRSRAWIANCSSILLVLGVGSAVIGFGWLSVQFLVNPRSLVWVNSYLPEPLQLKIPDWDQPHTLAEIEQQLKTGGLSMGDPIRLTASDQSDILIPIFAADRDCMVSHNVCRKILELRIYRPAVHPYRKRRAQHFQIIDQMAISGLSPWLVQAPFVKAQVDVPTPSDRLLEFTSIEVLDRGAPRGGTWLTLKGEHPQLGLYGQVLLYSPKTSTLLTMVPWSSPNGKLPTWENIASGGTPELVVNQTIGLETQYQIHALQPDSQNPSGVALRTIDLEQPALKNPAYIEAFQLARSGLWSLALQRLDALGKNLFAQNGRARLQRGVIAYHAKMFQAQAQRQSASTSQQVQAYLLDGRWEKAIAVVKAAPSDRADVLDLLNADSGQLLRRFTSALAITPNNSALQAWNAAGKLARDGQAAAIVWLKTQPANPDRNRLLSDLAPTLQPSRAPSLASNDRSTSQPAPQPALAGQSHSTGEAVMPASSSPSSTAAIRQSSPRPTSTQSMNEP